MRGGRDRSADCGGVRLRGFDSQKSDGPEKAGIAFLCGFVAV
jgi:hypothetical protein